MSKRVLRLISGLSCIVGVAMLVASFNLNPGLPGAATGPEMVQFAQQHYRGELWGAWLQAVGPVFIVLFAFALVHLAGATQRVAGWMTIFGATTLMTVSLIEITFYISGMFVFPEVMPVISIMLTLRLPDAVTAAGSIQPIWWLAAAITLMSRNNVDQATMSSQGGKEEKDPA